MTEPPRILGLSVLIARFVDASQPSWVECQFHDAGGQLWKIVEKVSVLTDQDVSESTELPTRGIVHCVEISCRADESGQQVVVIDTELPFDIEATDGTHRFAVLREQLQELSQLGSVHRAAKPLQVEDIERTLIDAATEPAQFAAALDVLLAYLLLNTVTVGHRVTDGVVLEHVRLTERQIVATGIAILIDQTVEPLSAELNLDASRTIVETGALYFGNLSGPPVSYGSRAHNKLSRNIIADPDRDFAWRHSWYRTDGRWSQHR